jgi:hypothetical protein
MSSPSPTAPGRIQRCRESVKHTFTNDEILEFSLEQNRDIQRIASLEEEKEGVVADFKAQIKSLETKVYDVSRRINQRYEMRLMDCEWHMHVPKEGKKTLIRVDTGEQIKVQDMDTFEKQEVLFDPEPPEEKDYIESMVDWARTPDDAAPDPAGHPLAAEEDKNLPPFDVDEQEPVTNYRRDLNAEEPDPDAAKPKRGRKK